MCIDLNSVSVLRLTVASSEMFDWNDEEVCLFFFFFFAIFFGLLSNKIKTFKFVALNVK